MSSASSKVKVVAVAIGRPILIFLGWVLIMVIYFTTYNQFERNAVPVSISPFRDFDAEQWDNGYFHAQGSLKNQSAENDGDQLVLATTNISCIKTSNTCIIGTADVYDRFMGLDVSSYNIDVWDSRSITFSDTSSICANSTYIVDRVAQTFNIAVHKKSVIPEYALKSPLHPCDNMKDKDLSLVSGRQTYDQKIRSFERANGLYLHLYLVALNLAYFALVGWSIWRRRQRHRAEGVTST